MWLHPAVRIISALKKKEKEKIAKSAVRLTTVSIRHSCNFRNRSGDRVIQTDVTRRAVAFNSLGNNTGRLPVSCQHALPGLRAAEGNSVQTNTFKNALKYVPWVETIHPTVWSTLNG